MDKFLLFGDSITEFCFDPQLEFAMGAALTNDYVRKIDVVNRGFAGYNSDWALKILPNILQKEPNVKLATVFFGTNDAVSHGVQHVELDKYKLNISNIIRLLKEKGIKIILISPGLHNETQWFASKPFDTEFRRSNKTNKLYVDELEKIAKSENISFINTYNLFQNYIKDTNSSDTELLMDGVHYTGKGYKLLYDELKNQINTWYPEFNSDNLQLKLPYWREVDPEKL